MPDASASNRRAPEDRFSPSVALEGTKKDAAVGGMRAAATGYDARPLVPAGGAGVRWSDVPMAIRNVAGVQFLGVQSIVVDAARAVATVVSPDGERGSVTATLQADGSVRVSAQVGVFPSPDRDSAFEHALSAELLRLGRIPRPQP
jgi:hypothetical protein